MFIAGVGLGRGYVHRADLTAERFVANPHGAAGSRMYRTGDVARWRGDGALEYLGRTDFQIKVRGNRIELGEIEAVLASHPAIKDAVVVAREDVTGHARLIGYVVAQPGGEISDEVMRGHVSARLPEYMVPSVFVTLPRLPVSANGKLDRKALPAPNVSASAEARAYLAPASEGERVLADVWGSVLRLDVSRISATDNFFALGGDSILSLQVIARAKQKGWLLTPPQIFQSPTIQQLALLMQPTVALQAEQGLVMGAAPLTPIQRWFFDQDWAAPNHFNQSVLLHLPTDTNVAAVRQALGAVIEHHDALRLRFACAEEGWAQSHAYPGDAEANHTVLDVVDSDAASLTRADIAVLIQSASARAQTSLDVTHGPMLRAVYLHLGAVHESRLLLVIHHLVVDGVSWRILLDDVQLAYSQVVAGQTVQLLSKTSSYQAWANRLSIYAQSGPLLRELDYWQTARTEPAPLLPADAPIDRSELTLADAVQIEVALTVGETQLLLQQVNAAYRTDTADVLIAALCSALSEWTGQCAVDLELEGHGREPLFADLDVSRTVGWFTARYPVRLHVKSHQPSQLLPDIKEQLRRVPNRGIGYGLLRYTHAYANASTHAHGHAHGLQTHAAPEVEFNYLGQFDQTLPVGEAPFRLASAAELEVSGRDVGPENRMLHPLVINAQVLGGVLSASWIFNTRLHERRTIDWVAGRFIEALRHLIAHASSPDAGALTPSDVSLANLDETGIADIAASVEFED